MERDIVCICEVAQDIDDLVALDFLNRSNRLKGVVLDPPPKTKEDWERVKKIKELRYINPFHIVKLFLLEVRLQV